jgi:hypothetical protein
MTEPRIEKRLQLNPSWRAVDQPYAAENNEEAVNDFDARDTLGLPAIARRSRLQAPVLHFVSPVENVERAMVVNYYENRRAAFMRHFGEQLHHLLATMAIERGGGFVGENKARLAPGRVSYHRNFFHFRRSRIP